MVGHSYDIRDIWNTVGLVRVLQNETQDPVLHRSSRVEDIAETILNAWRSPCNASSGFSRKPHTFTLTDRTDVISHSTPLGPLASTLHIQLTCRAAKLWDVITVLGDWRAVK